MAIVQDFLQVFPWVVAPLLAGAWYLRLRRSRYLRTRCLSLLRDVRRLKAELRRIRRLNVLLAHDLKGPWANILSSAQALDIISRTRELEPMHECLRHLRDEAERGLHGLSTYLEFQMMLLDSARTGLPNRVNLRAEIIRAVERARRLSDWMPNEVNLERVQEEKIGFPQDLIAKILCSLAKLSRKETVHRLSAVTTERSLQLEFTFADTVLVQLLNQYLSEGVRLTAPSPSLDQMALTLALAQIDVCGGQVQLETAGESSAALRIEIPFSEVSQASDAEDNYKAHLFDSILEHLHKARREVDALNGELQSEQLGQDDQIAR